MSADTNPYASPSEPEVNVLVDMPQGLPGRIGVWVILCIFSLLALLSLVAFVVQYNTTLPLTGDAYVDTNPGWVFGHLVRGIGLSILSWQLLCYVRSIRRITSAAHLQQASRRHAQLWNWGAIVLLAIAGYALFVSRFAIA